MVEAVGGGGGGYKKMESLVTKIDIGLCKKTISKHCTVMLEPKLETSHSHSLKLNELNKKHILLTQQWN